MKSIALAVAVAASVLAMRAMALDQNPSKKSHTHEKHEQKAQGAHIMLSPSDLQWKEAPNALPAGAQSVVLEGDPEKNVLTVIRLRFPAGYRVPPHTHPTAERVTVLEGSFSLGTGAKFEESALTNLPVGGFAVIQPKTEHFAMTQGGATLQLEFQGPFKIDYLDKNDDPRKGKTGR